MTHPYHLWPDVEIDGTVLAGAMESLLEQVVVASHYPPSSCSCSSNSFSFLLTRLGT